MSDKALPAIKNATVKVDLTYEDGTSRSHDFYLDDLEQEIKLDFHVAHDVIDMTCASFHTERHLEPGHRCSISLSISGRGPNTPTPTEQMLKGFYGGRE